MFTTEPAGTSDFMTLNELDSVAGCYQNMGQRLPDTPDRYLSQILWPGPEFDHKSITYIDISVAAPTTVLASAYGESGLINKSKFYQGQHFEFEAGKISITNELFGSLAYPADNPFIGAGRVSVTLGIDEQGHGKLAEKSTFAGTAFLFIPVAGQTSDSVKFIRVGDTCPHN